MFRWMRCVATARGGVMCRIELLPRRDRIQNLLRPALLSIRVRDDYRVTHVRHPEKKSLVFSRDYQSASSPHRALTPQYRTTRRLAYNTA